MSFEVNQSWAKLESGHGRPSKIDKIIFRNGRTSHGYIGTHFMSMYLMGMHLMGTQRWTLVLMLSFSPGTIRARPRSSSALQDRSNWSHDHLCPAGLCCDIVCCSLSDVKLSGQASSVLLRLSKAVSSKDEGNVERAFDGHRPNPDID
jgi:hypothetical protein